MNIVLLGCPGSGKGTQASLISKKYNLFHLSGGDIARSAAETDTRIADIVNSGKLIPEEEMTSYVMNYLPKVKPDFKNILFEGFPRFISQYEALNKFLYEKGEEIKVVFTLDLTEEEAVRRITSRRICKNDGEVYNLITKKPKTDGVCDICGGELIKRADDNEEDIKTRFENYYANTKKLTDFLKEKGKIISIDGSNSIDEIFKQIEERLEEYVR